MKPRIARDVGIWLRAALYAVLFSAVLYVAIVVLLTGDLPRLGRSQLHGLFVVAAGVVALFAVLPGAFTFFLFFLEGLRMQEARLQLLGQCLALGVAASIAGLAAQAVVASAIGSARIGGAWRVLASAISVILGPSLIIGYLWIRGEMYGTKESV